jgi:sulfonate transport system ATP-binding protein
MKAPVQGTHLQILDLTKNFGNVPVLKSVNLDVAPGQFIAIVGRSGCGKSTLLRLVAGLEKPTLGGVLLDEQPVRKINRTVRVMFQDARLLPWKHVIENVGLGLQNDWRSRAEWALEQVGLKERAREWPAVLSGGQRQRVALARALVSQPRLLLLDEPLGALDALTRIDMQRLIEKLWQEQQFTSLLVTHDVEEAVTLADRVIVIETGQIALDLPVTLPRPRLTGDAQLAQLKERVLERVMHREPTHTNNKVDAVAQLT